MGEVNHTTECVADFISFVNVGWKIQLQIARTSLELAGDVGMHSVVNRNQDRSLAEMTPEELSAIVDRWENEKAAIARNG